MDPVCTWIFLRIDCHQFYLTSFVPWNYGRIFFDLQDNHKKCKITSKMWIFVLLIYHVFWKYIDINKPVSGCILYHFTVIWWVNKNLPIIPRHKTGQIKLTASNFEKNSGVHCFHSLKIKRTIIEGFSRPGPIVPYIIYLVLSFCRFGFSWFFMHLYTTLYLFKNEPFKQMTR